MAVDVSSSDDDNMLREFAFGVEYSSLQRRIGVLKVLVEWLHSAQSSDTISKPQTRVLVRLLLNAVCSPQYLERVWIRRLYETTASATRSQRCPAFTPMCVATLAGEEQGHCAHDMRSWLLASCCCSLLNRTVPRCRYGAFLRLRTHSR